MTEEGGEQSKISLDAFCAALSDYVQEPVKPDSEIVKDLSIFGDDFAILQVHVYKNLGLTMSPDVDLTGRMPGEPHLLSLIGNLVSVLRGRSRSIFQSPSEPYSVRDLYNQLRPIEA